MVKSLRFKRRKAKRLNLYATNILNCVNWPNYKKNKIFKKFKEKDSNLKNIKVSN